MQPRAIVAASLLLLGGLSWIADARPVPRIAPADATAWEGQTVRIAGWAVDVQTDTAGGQRLSLRLGRGAVETRTSIGDVMAGDWVEATGRLARLAGRLTLLADALEVRRGPAPLAPSWDELAADPAAWSGQPVRLSGDLDGDWLREGTHEVRLGRGPWPANGPVVGVLAYDDGCLCHRLDAAPWTP